MPVITSMTPAARLTLRLVPRTHRLRDCLICLSVMDLRLDTETRARLVMETTVAAITETLATGTRATAMAVTTLATVRHRITTIRPDTHLRIIADTRTPDMAATMELVTAADTVPTAALMDTVATTVDNHRWFARSDLSRTLAAGSGHLLRRLAPGLRDSNSARPNGAHQRRLPQRVRQQTYEEGL